MASNFDGIVKKSKDVSLSWRSVPAPQRGEFIRSTGQELRSQKKSLSENHYKRS